MNKLKQIPLLLILITVSMLCAGFLKIVRGQSLFARRTSDETILQSREDSPDEFSSDGGDGSGSNSSSVDKKELPDSNSSQIGAENVSDSDISQTVGKDDEDPLAGTSEGSGSTSSDDAPDASGASDPSGDSGETTPETYAFTEVTREYLDNAVFIGDSRAEGVMLYSGWDNLTYYAEGGLTVYNIFERKVVQQENEKITIEEALQNHSFGKIYLEIGINEMGTGTVDSFMKQYEAVVSHLRELQPDAIIFLCGIMVVTEARSESDPIFNNPNIRERNQRIAALADQKDVFYLDFNEVVMDENGNLNTDYTWDAVHLLGKYDSLWPDYFCSHGIVK